MVSYEYFMDELNEFETTSLLEMLKYADKNSWQQTRFLMWTFLSPYMKKGARKKLEDILPLPFDPAPRKNKGPLSKEEKNLADVAAKQIENLIKDGKINLKKNKKS